MMTHWTIKILNALFVWSLGATVIWLFSRALVSDWMAKTNSIRGETLLLNVIKEGVSYLKMPLKKKRYSIGRETDCDIPIKGIGLPLKAEIRVLDGCCLFDDLIDDHHSTGGVGKIEKRVILKPGQELALCNYVLRIEER
jgi:hypothetical protein